MNIEGNTYLSQVRNATESNDSQGKYEAFRISVDYEQRLSSNFNLKFGESGEREGCNLVDINRSYML